MPGFKKKNRSMAEVDDELHIVCLDKRPVRGLLRFVGLLVGCLAVGVAFCFDLFAVYGETFKIAFGFTQIELALIISAANLGLISALPSAILVQKYDPRWLSGGAFILSTLSCLLIWGTTYHVEFYKEYFWISALFYFFLGCSGGLMYMVALSVNLLNFSKSHSGLISGIMHCMRSVVLGGLLVVYDVMYGRFGMINMTPIGPSDNTTTVNPPIPSKNVEEVHFLQEFFQLMLLVYGGVNFLACMFYGEYSDLSGDDESDPSDNGTDNEMIPIHASVPMYGTYGAASATPRRESTSAVSRNGTSLSDRESSVERKEQKKDQSPTSESDPPSTTASTADLVVEPQRYKGQANAEAGNADEKPPGPWAKLMGSRLFHWLLWPSVFLMAMRNAYITNISVIMASFSLGGRLRFVAYGIPIVGTVSTPLLGVLADFLGHKIPRSLFYFLLAGGLIFINLANMGFAGYFPVVVLTTVWYQLAASTVQTLGPSLQLKLFDSEAFPAGWGILTLLQTVLTLMAHFLLAGLYQVFTPTGVIICSGFKCYIIYFLVCSLAAYAAAVVVFFLVRYEFENMTGR